MIPLVIHQVLNIELLKRPIPNSVIQQIYIEGQWYKVY